MEPMEPGLLPASSLERLKSASGEHSLFSGDFTARDLLLLKQAGFAPKGLVFGASVFNVGYQYGGFVAGSIPTYAEAYAGAVGNAISRMEQEASLMGADGVINIEARITGMSEGTGEGLTQGMIEVVLIGTAIKHSGAESLLNSRGRPFMTELDADGLCGLLRVDCIPTGLAFGVDVQLATQYSGSFGFKSFEEPSMTQRIYSVRANSQMMAQQYAEMHGSEGIVDYKTRITFHRRETSSDPPSYYFLVFGFCLGTCVRRLQNSFQHSKSVQMTLSLAD